MNYNGRRFLEQFLPNVLENTNRELAEVIVADNASTDDSVFAVVHDKADRIFFICSNDLKHFQFTSVDCNIRQPDPEGIT